MSNINQETQQQPVQYVTIPVSQLPKKSGIMSTMFTLLLVVLYVCMPLDVIPDAIPLCGWADDLAVIYYGLKKAFS